MRFQLLVFFVLVGSVVFADDNLVESKSITKIELLGGNVTRDETLPGSPVVAVNLHGSKRFNDKYVHLLTAFESLKSLNLDGTKITDNSLKEISKLASLTELRLHGTQITYEELKEDHGDTTRLRFCERH